MLKPIAQDIWHLQHNFVASGLRVSSRMTVVRLHNGALWLHSPVPLSAEVCAQLRALGDVKYIVAPNKMHHLFLSACTEAFPNAQLFGAPGLRKKRPDLPMLHELQRIAEPQWAQDLSQTFFGGMPIGNETVWFHKPSKTLIVTDLLQLWKGDLPFASRAFAMLTGVSKQLSVPRTVRLAIKDKAAARASAEQILQYPFERVVVAHNAIVEDNAHAAVEEAFRYLIKQ
jgi:hypothetical protein